MRFLFCAFRCDAVHFSFSRVLRCSKCVFATGKIVRCDAVWLNRTAPHRTASHRTAPHRTAPHRITPKPPYTIKMFHAIYYTMIITTAPATFCGGSLENRKTSAQYRQIERNKNRAAQEKTLRKGRAIACAPHNPPLCPAPRVFSGSCGQGMLPRDSRKRQLGTQAKQNLP